MRIPGTDELEESLAVVPLRYGSRVTGAIVISKLGIDQFDEDDVRLLEVLAGQASVALENARLYEQQRREAEGAKALLAFADELSRAQSFDEICRARRSRRRCRSSRPSARRSGSTTRAPRTSASRSPRACPCAARRRATACSGRVVLDARGARRGSRAAARVVRLPGVGRAAEGAPLLEAARGGRDRERAARREPRARDRGVAGRGARPQRRGDRARARHAPRASLWIEEEAEPRDLVARASFGYHARGRPRGRPAVSRASSRTSGSSAPIRSCSSRADIEAVDGRRREGVARVVVAPLRARGQPRRAR